MSRAAMTDRYDPTLLSSDSRGVPWEDAQITLRVRSSEGEPPRIVRSSSPTLIIGRHPRADISFRARAVAPRHALLVLDRRGLFCVDLLSRTGTRLAGRDLTAGWVEVGETLEIAGNRLEILRLKVGGSSIDPSPCDEDLFAPAALNLPRVTIHPVHSEGTPPWVLGSALAFLGRSSACALRVPRLALAPIHCAIWRGMDSVRVIDLIGRTTEVNGRSVVGSAPLKDGDVLRVGLAHFAITVGEPVPPRLPALVRGQVVTERVETSIVHATPVPSGEPSLADMMSFLRQFQGDAATLIEGQFGQINALRSELAAMREELRDDRPLPLERHQPFALDVPATPQSEDPSLTAAWMLDQIGSLEPENQSRWKSLISRFTAALAPRSTLDPTSSSSQSPKSSPL